MQGWLVSAAEVNQNVRYEPEEVPPRPVFIGLGVQAGVVTLAPIVVGVFIVMRVVDASGGYSAWAGFGGAFRQRRYHRGPGGVGGGSAVAF